MKRAEFVEAFTAQIEAKCNRMIKAGTLRPSEACMEIADVPERALKLWRKHAHFYRARSIEQFKKEMGWE